MGATPGIIGIVMPADEGSSTMFAEFRCSTKDHTHRSDLFLPVEKIIDVIK
jgi:hypothetical protein